MSLEFILMVVIMLAERLGLHSKNSSIPPSQDKNRKNRLIKKAINLLVVKQDIKVQP
jgi:dihydroxyacid dehydratase/phosphogluconate dehydratase